MTVLDSYVRGVPDWLSRLSTADGLNLVEHDIRQPLPEDIGHFEYVVHAAGIASPTYYRQFPLETMDANVTGLRQLLDRVVEAQRPRPATRTGSSSSRAVRSTATRLRTRSQLQRRIAATSPAPGRALVTTSPSATARRCASTLRVSTGSQ